MNTGVFLAERQGLVYRWYEGMVNSDTGTLEYLYIPRKLSAVRGCPIPAKRGTWRLLLLCNTCSAVA
jgi:hypothetical protein